MKRHQHSLKSAAAAIIPISLMLTLCSEALGQRLTERWLTINPLSAKIAAQPEESWKFLTMAQMWGEFGPYRFTRDNDHAWDVKIGGFIELFRIRDEGSLTFQSSIELISDPHNELRLNPRAIYWEEGFVYTMQSSTIHYQLGYYQRCKHDIDNLLPSPSSPYLPVQRALIYGGIVGKHSFHGPHHSSEAKDCSPFGVTCTRFFKMTGFQILCSNIRSTSNKR